MFLVWPFPSLERESYWGWIMRKISMQSHSIRVLVIPPKPPGYAMDNNDGQVYDMKIIFDIGIRMYGVLVQYGILVPKCHLSMCFFQFISGITLKWDYIIWHISDLLMWIDLWNKLRIYSLSPYPINFSCQVFGVL